MRESGQSSSLGQTFCATPRWSQAVLGPQPLHVFVFSFACITRGGHSAQQRHSMCAMNGASRRAVLTLAASWLGRGHFLKYAPKSAMSCWLASYAGPFLYALRLFVRAVFVELVMCICMCVCMSVHMSATVSHSHKLSLRGLGARAGLSQKGFMVGDLPASLPCFCCQGGVPVAWEFVLVAPAAFAPSMSAVGVVFVVRTAARGPDCVVLLGP